MKTFADVIARWPTAESLGADIGERGVTVRAWRNRNSIPSGHWDGIISAAGRRGFADVTAQAMIRIAAGGRLSGPVILDHPQMTAVGHTP